MVSSRIGIVFGITVFQLYFQLSVNAGVCLEKQVGKGHCTSLTKTNITKEECCSNYGNYYTSKDYVSGELFLIHIQGGRYPNCLSCEKWKESLTKNLSTSVIGASVVKDKCKDVNCGPNKLCKVRHNTITCVCKRPKCKRLPASPVCSNFNKTYRNDCALKRYACINSKEEYVAYNGPCRDSCKGVQCGGGKQCIEFEDQTKIIPYCVQCNRLCTNTASSGPVCGADNVTYFSYCELRTATCKRGKTIGIAYTGPCKVKANCSNVVCSTDMLCVMSDDNQPRCIRCSNHCNPLVLSSLTAAPIGREMCGTDHETYPNMCALTKNSCKTGKFIGILHHGMCKTANCSSVSCQNGETCLMDKIKPHCVLCSMAHCTTVVKLALKTDPQHYFAKNMCGTDQNNYPNWCALRQKACKSGTFIDIQHQGPCKASNVVKANFTDAINGPSDQSYKPRTNQYIDKLKNKTITVRELMAMLQTFGLKVDLQNSSKWKRKTVDVYSFFCHLLRSFTKANIIGCS